MDYSEKEINDAINTQRLVCQKLLEIMDLQGDIDSIEMAQREAPQGRGFRTMSQVSHQIRQLTDELEGNSFCEF